MISLYGVNMNETQVLFRIDSELLEDLDTTIHRSGFKTRNEWFRNVIRTYLEDMERKKVLKKLEMLNVEGMTEADIVEMVKAWRT